MNDLRLDFPATGRNSQAICDVLSPHFTGKTGDVLEIGSGSGQHALRFAETFPSLTFWPTDIEPRHLASIDAWFACHVVLPRVLTYTVKSAHVAINVLS